MERVAGQAQAIRAASNSVARTCGSTRRKPSNWLVYVSWTNRGRRRELSKALAELFDGRAAMIRWT